MENQIRKIAEEYFRPEEIDSVSFLNGRAVVTILNSGENEETAALLREKIKSLPGVKKASVIFTAEKKPQGLHPQEEKWQIRGVKKIIAVASGKGGVGKSTTSVNLALALSSLGQRVALFDADIYGPSIPTMLGYEGVGPVSYDGKILEPFEYMGIKSMSIGTLVGKDTPLIWRGAKACGAIQQLLTDVNWGETDIMVIDMPPGTGDIQITLSQKLNFSGAVIFVHGWIPCLTDSRTHRPREFYYNPKWREASPVDWEDARWYNGIDCACSWNVIEPNKTIVCGHFHSSYGHFNYGNNKAEFGDDADFSPFYSEGIIAIDGCTAYSGKVNCIMIDD